MIVRNGGISRYSAVGKMQDFYSEVQGFEHVSGTLAFVDMKISNQPNAAFFRELIL